MKRNLTTILLIAAILLLVNLFACRYFVRLDLTKSHEFTLSQSSKKDFKIPWTTLSRSPHIFSKDLPANIAKVRTDFKDLLVEYSNRSRGRSIMNL